MGLFHFDFSPLGQSRVDSENGVVYGVTVITSGKEARGHDLFTDNKTLVQMFESAKAHGDRIPTKLDHKTGISEVNGFLTNFRIAGPKLIADWHLLKTQSGFDHTLELCQTMSDIVGLSASFTGEGEMTGAGKMARCTDLISVDFVTSPAVNKGLFETKIVDNVKKSNMADNDQLLQSLSAIQTQLTQFSDRLNGIEAFQQAQNERYTQEEEALLQEAYEAGLIDENGNEIEQVEEPELIEQYEDDDVVASAFSTLANRVINLESILGQNQENNERDQLVQAFNVLQDKIVELTQQRDHAIQLAESYSVPRTAMSPASNLFEASLATNEFEQVVSAKVAEGMKKSEAITFAVKHHPEAFKSYKAGNIQQNDI